MSKVFTSSDKISMVVGETMSLLGPKVVTAKPTGLAKENTKIGHWEWSNATQTIVFVPFEVAPEPEKQSTPDVKRQIFSRGIAYEVLNFRDTLNDIQTAAFERQERRKSNFQPPPIITLADIKALVLFLVVEPLPPYFLRFFHTGKVDRWLRGVIVYMHFFTETCEELMSTIDLLRGPPPLTGPPRYMVMSKDLTDLRFIVGRQHSLLVLSALGSGAGGSVKRAHSGDVGLFELLMQLAVRIVWISQSRRYLNLIDTEMNRIFRTSAFSMKNTKTRDEISENFVNPKTRDILYGNTIEGLDCFGNLKRSQKEKPLTILQNSMVLQDFQSVEDNGLLQIGIPKFHTNNARLKFLTKCFYASEEELAWECIDVGILGKSRSEFDVLLHPIPKLTDELKSKLSLVSSKSVA